MTWLIGTGWTASFGYTGRDGNFLVDDGVDEPTEYGLWGGGLDCNVSIYREDITLGHYTVKLTLTSGEGGLTSFR